MPSIKKRPQFWQDLCLDFKEESFSRLWPWAEGPRPQIVKSNSKPSIKKRPQERQDLGLSLIERQDLRLALIEETFSRLWPWAEGPRPQIVKLNFKPSIKKRPQERQDLGLSLIERQDLRLGLIEESFSR